MSLWDNFKRALGEQARSLRTSWSVATATEPKFDSIPEELRPFFESKYPDFIKQAHYGAALEATTWREETKAKDAQQGGSMLLSFGTQIPVGSVKTSEEINQSFIKDFARFLRQCEVDRDTVEQAKNYIVQLSREGIQQRRKEHADRRASFHAALTPSQENI